MKPRTVLVLGGLAAVAYFLWKRSQTTMVADSIVPSGFPAQTPPGSVRAPVSIVGPGLYRDQMGLIWTNDGRLWTGDVPADAFSMTN